MNDPTTRRLNVPAPQQFGTHAHKTVEQYAQQAAAYSVPYGEFGESRQYREEQPQNFSMFERAMFMVTCIAVCLAVVTMFVVLYKVNLAIQDVQEQVDNLRNSPLFGG